MDGSQVPIVVTPSDLVMDPGSSVNVTVTLSQDSPAAGLIMAHATATYHFAVGVPFLPAQAGTYVARTDVPISAS